MDWKSTRKTPALLALRPRPNLSESVLSDPGYEDRASARDLLNILSGLPGAEVALAKMGVLPLLGGVVKGKGGNWLAGSVEDALRGLKSPYVRTYADAVERYGPERAHQYAARPRPGDEALNNWIEGPLTKYVKTRMASPEDEVRKLAEHGVLHIDPAQLTRGSRQVHPSGEHLEKLAQTPGALRWENAADQAVIPTEARSFLSTRNWRTGVPTVEANPWLTKVAPDSTVYDLAADMRPEHLGFPHLIDELSNALNPASGLPRNLQLTPEAMKQLSMEKAVRRVADINAWRSEQAALAAKKAAEEILKREALRTYDDQWRWLSVPDTSTPEGMSLAKDLGCRGGWCTQGESAAKQYGSGGQRLHVLIDAEGRPHAQIQTSAPMRSLKEVRKALVDEGNDPTLAEEILAEELKTNQPRISQIKPPENSWGGARVAEYTKRNPNYQSRVQAAMQDFVRNSPLGGQWSDVGDLGNAGLWRNPKTGAFHTKAEAEADEALQALYESRNLGPNGEYLGNRYAQGGAVKPTASWNIFD